MTSHVNDHAAAAAGGGGGDDIIFRPRRRMGGYVTGYALLFAYLSICLSTALNAQKHCCNETK